MHFDIFRILCVHKIFNSLCKIHHFEKLLEVNGCWSQIYRNFHRPAWSGIHRSRPSSLHTLILETEKARVYKKKLKRERAGRLGGWLAGGLAGRPAGRAGRAERERNVGGGDKLGCVKTHYKKGAKT
jgi:hypothetical protein